MAGTFGPRFAVYPPNQILALDANNVSGTTWTDLTGNGNDFTLIGSPTYNGAVGGGALEFESDGQYAEIAASTGVFDLQEYSIVFWYYLTNNSYRYPIFWSYDNAVGGTYYAQEVRIDFTVQTHELNWNDGAAHRFLSPSTVNPADRVGTWNMLGVSFKSGQQRVYLNGTQIGTSTRADTITYGNNPVWIGKAPFANRPRFKMSIVKFYNEALDVSGFDDEWSDNRSRFGL